MNIPEVTFWVWYPVITILLAIPVFCWYDWKYREIPDWMFALLAIVNAPVLLMQYLATVFGFSGFGWEEVAVSILPCVIYYIIMRSKKLGDFFHGDDMLFLWCISLFCVINPLHPNAGALPVTVMIYLIPVMASFYFWEMVKTVSANIRKATREEIPSLEDMITKDLIVTSGKNFPLVIPISVAFILAVVI